MKTAVPRSGTGGSNPSPSASAGPAPRAEPRWYRGGLLSTLPFPASAGPSLPCSMRCASLQGLLRRSPAGRDEGWTLRAESRCYRDGLLSTVAFPATVFFHHHSGRGGRYQGDWGRGDGADCFESHSPITLPMSEKANVMGPSMLGKPSGGMSGSLASGSPSL